MSYLKFLFIGALLVASALASSSTCPSQQKKQLKCPSFKVGVSHFACSKLDNNPVCVKYNDGTTKTFQNSCFGCAADSADIKHYTEGACPIVAPKKQQCPKFKVGVSHFACSNLDNSPVCVKYNNGTAKTFQNSCFGCAADAANIAYFTDGACAVSTPEPSPAPVSPHSSGPARLLCPQVRLGVSHFACSSLDNSPVCAEYNNGTAKTFQNSCFACASQDDLAYYTNGACAVPADQQEQCPTIVGVSFIACNGLGQNPVCVRYNNGTVASFDNSCFACAADKADITYFSAGACY